MEADLYVAAAMRNAGPFWGTGMRILLLLCALTVPSIAAEVRVVDGDTLRLGDETIRILDIDAPEAGQKCKEAGSGTWACGTAAVTALTELVAGHDVDCVGDGIDEFGRRLAVCSADGQDIGAEMVRTGMAWSFRQYGDRYNDLEDEVRPTGVGIWQADTQAPWGYRAERWAVPDQEAPDGCPIKGNIARDGERIYHAPWSPWYSRTKVSVSNGERWFCDEGEALEAGWRAPLWGG